jgi:hypothetical protein
MGIREYFEKQPKDKDLKFQNLNLELDDEKEELKFDPEKEISNVNWQEIKTILKYLEQYGYWENLVRQAASMKILCPEKSEELQFEDSTWQKLIERLRDYGYGTTWREFAWQAMFIKILDPKKFKELEISRAWEKLKVELKVFKNIEAWGDFARRAACMKSIFPEKSAVLQLDDTALQGMKERLQFYRSSNQWFDFIQQAAFIKILYPEKSAEPQINDQDWRMMMQKYKKLSWEKKPWLAACLTILAAQKVEVTDKGLKITMRKEDLKAKEKPRPERKKF